MNATDTDIAAMRQAIAASREARERGDMPFGAVLAAPDGKTLWVAKNNQVSSGDCTGHAETALVREAVSALGAEALRGATVYASGEPCAMCAGAMFWAGIRRIVFAAPTVDMAEPLGGPQLPLRCAQVLAGAVPAVLVEGPLLREEALAELSLPGPG